FDSLFVAAQLVGDVSHLSIERKRGKALQQRLLPVNIRVNQHEGADFLPFSEKLPCHFQRHVSAEGISPEQIRSFGLKSAQVPQINLDHVFHPVQNRLAAIEAAGLDSVKRLIARDIACQIAKAQHAASHSVNEIESGLVAFGL